MMRKLPKKCGEDAPIFSEPEFEALVNAIGDTYGDRTGVNLQEDHNLPGQREVFEIVGKLLEVVFPGFSEAPRHHDSLNAETAVLLSELRHTLFDQILRALRYGCSCGKGDCCGGCNFF